MTVSVVEEREGIFTHVINSPVELLYLSISWSSFVSLSDAMNRMSEPSELALLWRSESVMLIRTGKSVKSPATLDE